MMLLQELPPYVRNQRILTDFHAFLKHHVGQAPVQTRHLLQPWILPEVTFTSCPRLLNLLISFLVSAMINGASAGSTALSLNTAG